MATSPGDDEEVVVTRRQLRAFEAAVKNREKALYECERRSSDIRQAQALWEKSKVDAELAADELIKATNALYDRAPVKK